MIARSRIAKRRKSRGYERMMETLLLQNQQLIIQQQNMLFMFIKQHNNAGSQVPSTLPNLQATSIHQHHQQQDSTPSHHNNHNNHNHNHNNQQHHSHHQSPHHQSQHQQQHQQQQQQQNNHHHHNQSQQQHHQQAHHQQQNGHNTTNGNNNNNSQHHSSNINEEPTMQSQHHQQIFSQATNSSIVDTQEQLQQVASQLQEHQGTSYLTPAASEQDPISDKQEEEDLAALLDGDGLLHNNYLYNPQTDIGSITPYKSQPNQHQTTSSYYSSGCESLTTPRMEQPQQRQLTTANINQNVVKNLADSFKSPTKPKINVQFMSNSATGSMKNSKAKIIQSMNISQFLRHVHPEVESKTSSQ